MAGCIARTTSQPPPGNDDPELLRGWTLVSKPFLPSGGVFLTRRVLVSAPTAGDDDPEQQTAGRTLRTPLGQSNFQIWRRVISQVLDDPTPFEGLTGRIKLAGTGQAAIPITPRRNNWPPIDPPEPQDSGWTRWTPIPGTGQAAAPRVPPRPVYTDDSPPDAGWTTRGTLGRTGQAYGPVVRRRVSADPDGGL